MNNLVIKAGPVAYEKIRRDGLQPDMISHLVGAAGGPKWLVLNRLDRYLFGEWFRGRSKPLVAVGSSVGSWRLACAAQRDPLAAIQRFEDAYLAQRYALKPTPAEITAEARRMLGVILGAGGAQEVINHPWLRLHIIAARARLGTGSSSPLTQKAAMLAAIAANTLHRRGLALFFERVVFHTPPEPRLQLRADGFRTHQVLLHEANLSNALLASAAIPMVMQALREVGGAPAGALLDGGMVDYHMDLPLQPPAGIVLLPHFSETVTPGWLDKFLPWRKPGNLTHTVLIAPSREFIARLPNGKIPDRNDFYRYSGRDEERERDWRRTVNECQRLADEFIYIMDRDRLPQVLKTWN
ncbi:MAG: patatin-like phospholipase family protein [Nevskiales bacterium]